MIAETRATCCLGRALVASCCQTDQAAEAKMTPSWHDFTHDLCTYMFFDFAIGKVWLSLPHSTQELKHHFG